MILIGNQNGILMKLGNNFTCILSKSLSLDKTRVKLFPTFTRHHLITHTNSPNLFSR